MAHASILCSALQQVAGAILRPADLESVRATHHQDLLDDLVEDRWALTTS